MASGSTHLNYTAAISIASMFIAAASNSDPLYCAIAAFSAGLFPDLDLKHSLPSKTLPLLYIFIALATTNPLIALIPFAVTSLSKHRGGTHCVVSSFVYSLPFFTFGVMPVILSIVSYNTHLLLDDSHSSKKRKEAIEAGKKRNKMKPALRWWGEQESLIPYLLVAASITWDWLDLWKLLNLHNYASMLVNSLMTTIASST